MPAFLRRNPVLYFVFGFLLGCLTIFINSPGNHYTTQNPLPRPARHSDEISLEHVPNPADGMHQHDHGEGHAHANEGHQVVMFRHEHDEGELSKLIKSEVRILCWIMTSRNNTYKKAVHVNATWAQRCNKHVFITTRSGTLACHDGCAHDVAFKDSGLPTVDLGLKEGPEQPLGKDKRRPSSICTRQVNRIRCHVHINNLQKELNNYDWFLKADDDTYVIVENLRYMLLAYSPSDPVYFGCRFRPFIKQGYMSGGAGYALSREALRRFVEQALPDTKKCKQQDSGAEDAEMGKCLANVGVIAGDSRDSTGRHRMLPFSPTSHMESNSNKSMPSWFHQYMYYPYLQGGDECCSDYMVSFHYVGKATMYALHNLLYHIRAFGLSGDDNADLKRQAETANLTLLDAARTAAKQMSMPLSKTT
ncbi:glycoprotein-N-acetylgalactosamine 3-beta-galactosyltransferase 1 [Aphelenchoides avenae]|nr:glycoprotein-N-acetylgalactosamine 3-beta-galactosyltransferase 1 [Aphelenchus avenae]